MLFESRKSPRLPNYDYSQKGKYFITFCTRGREPLLSKIDNGKVILSDYGNIIEHVYSDLPNHNRINILEYCIMPDHMHCIIEIKNTGDADMRKIINQLKAFSVRYINDFRKEREMMQFPSGYLWQKSFYDHIIRNDCEYYQIVKYINENPLKYNKR